MSAKRLADELERLGTKLTLADEYYVLIDECVSTLRAQEGMVPMPTEEERSWPEDQVHENGNYFCICWQCKRSFIGHKRRQICRVCAAAQSTEQNAGDPEDAVCQDHGILHCDMCHPPAPDKLVELELWAFKKVARQCGWSEVSSAPAYTFILRRIESDAAEKEQLKRRIAELWRSNDRHAKDHLKCINELNLAQRNGKLAIERAEKAEAALKAKG